MLRIFKRISKKELLLSCVSVIFICLQVWMELKIPDYMSEITTLLQNSGTQVKDILGPSGLMIVLSLLSLGASILVGFLASRIAASFTQRIRHDVYHQVMSFSSKEIHQFSIPSLVTRSTNDVTQIQQIIAMGLQVVIKGPITAVWALTKIANKSWAWTATTGVAILVLLIMLSIILICVRPKFMVVQTLTDKINSITRENLTGIRVIRAFNAENFQNQRFAQVNEELTQTNLFTNRLMALMSPVMSAISSGLTLAVYWIGAYLIYDATGATKITLFSDMVVFSSYAMQIVMGFMLMLMIFLFLPRAMVSAKRLNEVLDVEPSIEFVAETKPAKEKRAQKGEVEFVNVSFAYSEDASPVVENLSFKAKTGQTIAFIGSTGSGKSTAINLIPRFYDASSGQILINGQDVKNYSKKDLNNIVGYIPQKPVLFSGTIQSNLELGESNNSPLDTEKIHQALTVAQAQAFVSAEKEGIQSPVAQGGTNFSGGQKQRLAIARVVARKPEILIFDDSFSALDYKTDTAMRKMLATDCRETTKLIVAQRISTIMDADEIIVLDEGQVVGQGTHQDLLKNNRVYQEIAYSQLSKEELAND